MREPPRGPGSIPLFSCLLLILACIAAGVAHPAGAGEPPRRQGGESSTVASVTPAEDRIVAAVSRDRTHRIVRDLVALGPRMGGTASGDRAAAYVDRRLREIGLDVVVVEEPPRDLYEVTAWEASLLAPEQEKIEAWPCGLSPPMAATEVDLRIAPPPDGSIHSPWALLTGEDPASAAKQAARSGAAAALTDAPRIEGRFTNWAPATFIPRGLAPSAPVWTTSFNAGRKIRAWIESGKAVRARLALDARSGSGRPRTVVGTLKGSRPGWYMICAHGDSDSGSPGANDNASGVASLLEAAAALSDASSKGLLPAGRPSVRFAVWGSEIASARTYIDRVGADLPGLLGVFNYDQTGFGAAGDALYFEGNDVPWNATILQALMSAASDRAGRDGFPRRYTTNPSLGGTDAYAFLPPRYRGFGRITREIPAITIFTSAWGTPQEVAQTPGWQSKAWPERDRVTVDFDPYYHSSGDLPALTTDLVPDGMARCARAVALAIYGLMAREAGEASPGAGAPPRKPAPDR